MSMPRPQQRLPGRCRRERKSGLGFGKRSFEKLQRFGGHTAEEHPVLGAAKDFEDRPRFVTIDLEQPLTKNVDVENYWNDLVSRSALVNRLSNHERSLRN